MQDVLKISPSGFTHTLLWFEWGPYSPGNVTVVPVRGKAIREMQQVNILLFI